MKPKPLSLGQKIRASLDIWRGVEKRGSLQSPPEWLLQLIGGFGSASGIRVNAANAIELAPVYACVQVLAQTMSCLPLTVFQIGADGESKTRAKDHPLYPLLRISPNPEMTAAMWTMAVMCHLALWGNHYSEIERDRLGRVKGLWPMMPSRVRVMRRNDTNELYYIVNLVKGGEKILSPDNILHISGLTFNGINGLSPIGAARETIGLGLGAQEYGARFFGNSGRPSGVLEHPGELSDEARKRLMLSWEESHQGLEQAQRTAILEEGMKFHAVGTPPEDAQFIETRKFSAEDVCRIYRVPPHKIGIMDRATHSNIEQQNIEFVTDTILPWATLIEAQVLFKMLPQKDWNRFLLAYELDALMRGDMQSRNTAYSIGRQWGWLSANDVRRRENMNPLPPAVGDVYMSPVNMTPTEKLGEVQRPPIPPKGAPDAERSEAELALAGALHRTNGHAR